MGGLKNNAPYYKGTVTVADEMEYKDIFPHELW